MTPRSAVRRYVRLHSASGRFDPIARSVRCPAVSCAAAFHRIPHTKKDQAQSSLQRCRSPLEVVDVPAMPGRYSRPPPPPREPNFDARTFKYLSTSSGGGGSAGPANKEAEHSEHRCSSSSANNEGRIPSQQSSKIPSSPPPGTASRSSTSSLDSESALLRMMGSRWSPYGRLARIDKPAGTLLLLFPCWWSIALAAPLQALPDLKLMALFATGAVVMR